MGSSPGKVLMDSALEDVVLRLKEDGKTIVFTNGCFDVIHVGHIRHLKQARDLGDILMVGLNSDSSVRLLKGPGRPLVPENERAEVLAALECVDYVAFFSEETPFNIINRVLPDVLVKGGDWPVDKIVGADIVQESGGKVLSLPFHPGKSSSDIIRKIEAL